MLAEYLKQLRLRSQQTSGQLAAQAGISRTSVWRWEQGKVLPRDEELRSVLSALSASTAERTRALEFLAQERVARGVHSVLALTQTNLNRYELLRALRLRSGWPQREAAERLGIHRVTLANWESGDHWPEVATLHQACRLYKASPDELAALTTLSPPPAAPDLSDPNEVIWDDIETFTGDFGELELRYLTSRARLARIPTAAAREREIACTLDYLHSFMLQSRSGEMRRELRRIAPHPILLSSPALLARHQVLYASAQQRNIRGDIAAEKAIRRVLDLGDAAPIDALCRAKFEWADRRNDQADPETALRLSSAAFQDAEASGDPHLIAIAQREQTAALIDAGEFGSAARSLDSFPTHTPLFAVQKIFTQGMLLHAANSIREASSAYSEAAHAAETAGMTEYGSFFKRMASSLVSNT